MSSILGLSAFYHDSAAAQEERFTRLKHDHEFPKHAVDYCLQEAGRTPEQFGFVVFYHKALLKIEHSFWRTRRSRQLNGASLRVER
jgi:carbamoyltransferase